YKTGPASITTSGGSVLIQNNIFSVPGSISANEPSVLSVDHNIWPGTEPLDTNPVSGVAIFTNAAAGDFSLQSGSAGINVGALNGVTGDYVGASRPLGGGEDVGPYESCGP